MHNSILKSATKKHFKQKFKPKNDLQKILFALKKQHDLRYSQRLEV